MGSAKAAWVGLGGALAARIFKSFGVRPPARNRSQTICLWLRWGLSRNAYLTGISFYFSRIIRLLCVNESPTFNVQIYNPLERPPALNRIA